MEIKIGSVNFTGETYIGIFNEVNGKRYIAKPVKFEFVECEEGVSVEPTIRLGMTTAQQFLKALAEALDKQGVKTDKDAKIEGLLEATRYHLEDIRKVAKIK